MRVLVVGGGAREHAIADAIRRSESTVFVAAPHPNPGLAALSEAYLVGSFDDHEHLLEFARQRRVELAVIGPEAPLAAGLADVLRGAGVPTVGPGRSAARIETSKRFCREFLVRHGVDASPRFDLIETPEAIDRVLPSFPSPFVLKPVGLTGGKGVLVQGADFATIEDARRLLKRAFLAPGAADGFLVEERLEGEEFSLMMLVTDDGVAPMPAVQDYKRALEGGGGGNTGGMGSYSQRDHLLPFLSPAHRDKAAEILSAIVAGLRSDGLPYRGILYGGFMLTASGPKLLECNARFGDPEGVNVLPLYEPGDAAELFAGIAEGHLRRTLIQFRLRATVVKYVVPVGYGGVPQLGAVIEYDQPAIEDAGVRLFFGSGEPAGGGKLRLGSSRGLALEGEASAIWEAGERVEQALKRVRGSYYVRHDIATKADLDRRVEHMRQLFSPGAKPSPLPLSVAAPDAPPDSKGRPEQLV